VSKLKPILALLGVVVLLLALLYFSETPPAGAPPLASLANDLEPLRHSFNSEAGKVRLLLLMDPT
jgi:hypothetical protein